MATTTPATLGQLLDTSFSTGVVGPETGVGLVVAVTLVSVAPAILISLTSFTRITIVLAFLRQGLGLPGVPPNQVLAALALFLTLFSMQPTLDEIWAKAAQPYLGGKTTALAAAQQGAGPLREFMLKQTRSGDLMLFARLSGGGRPKTPSDLSLVTLAASYLLSELKTGFQIGLVILLPFLLIDLAVSLVITSLGLSGLSPATAALPVKLALFVSVDGWNLVVGSLLRSIH